jgi:SAM-dependent methyltransferase
VLDVGCGTGIAAVALAARGSSVLGVEPDERMAAHARDRGVEVEVATFESWDAAGRTFDLLTSGQAWHWVDPVLGARKAASVLVPGGRIALFWNQGHPEEAVREGFDAVYQSKAPETDKYSIMFRNPATSRYASAFGVLRGEGGFLEVEVRAYPWERTYSRDEWLDQLVTHSDHRVMDPDARGTLLAAIGDVIDDNGGSFSMRYTCNLVTGVRPG